jgi:AcrR family transcriptional regulator
MSGGRARAGAKPHAPRPAPLAGASPGPLSPTAARIVEAAKRIVSEKGFSALTLEAIASEADVNKAATRYHFGSKAGLVEAMVDEIVLDECASMARDLEPDATLDERLDSFLESVRRMAVDPSTFGGFYDILPHALRDPDLRARLVSLYEVWYAWNLEWLVGDDAGDRRDALEGLGALAAATIDGIAVQASIHGEAYDPEPTLHTFRLCLEALLSTDQGTRSTEVMTP